MPVIIDCSSLKFFAAENYFLFLFSANPSEFLNTGYFPLRYSFL
ncbi:hypothetical protein D347_00471 [Enterococcus faecalis LA3B-2]|nr:hypothetical protein D347_00471 [Enterococcus faecalis LA3B-2]